MSTLDYEGAEREALTRLARLPSKLVYHSLSHTRDDVLPAAERLAQAEGVTGEALLLLRTAVLYHDIGFTEVLEGHEKVSARVAGAVLPEFGYSEEQIDTVRGMIMATRLPQSPHSLLEELLADADLDVLGRSDFTTRNQDLRRELAEHGSRMPDREWYAQQIAFLKEHRYFTQTAKRLRDAQKARNLERLVERLEEL